MSELKTKIMSIGIEPEELIERVDDMLAWLAVASVNKDLHYDQQAMFRAQPVVLLGKDHDGVREYGELTPKSVLVEDYQDDDDFDFEQHIKDLRSKKGFLARWVCSSKSINHSILTEHDITDDVSLMSSSIRYGDDVSDLHMKSATGNDGEVFHINEQLGTQYELGAVGFVAEIDRKAFVRAAKLPQVAKVVRLQQLIVLHDGRSEIRHSFVAAYNNELFTMRKERLGTWSRELSHIQHAFVEHERRRRDWIVELSLGKQRTGVGLRTDAMGARELVNSMRGTQLGARRKALIHWVDEHMRRRNRLDREATVKVAGHLRGTAGVDCGRYHARIWPASSLSKQPSFSEAQP